MDYHRRRLPPRGPNPSDLIPLPPRDERFPLGPNASGSARGYAGGSAATSTYSPTGRARLPTRLRRPLGRNLGRAVHERLEQFGELHREHVLRGWAGPEGFQGLQILEAHRIDVHGLGDLEDPAQGQRKPFGTEDRGLAVSLRLQDRRLLFPFGDGDGGLFHPVRLRDERSPAPFGGH